MSLKILPCPATLLHPINPSTSSTKLPTHTWPQKRFWHHLSSHSWYLWQSDTCGAKSLNSNRFWKMEGRKHDSDYRDCSQQGTDEKNFVGTNRILLPFVVQTRWIGCDASAIHLLDLAHHTPSMYSTSSIRAGNETVPFRISTTAVSFSFPPLFNSSASAVCSR